MKKKLKLFVGPISPPIHGQSIAFTAIYESMKDEVVLINTNSASKGVIKKSLTNLGILYQVFVILFTKRIESVYFTCSRSFWGSIRDIFLINFADMLSLKLTNHLHGSDFYEFLHQGSHLKLFQKLLLYSYSKVNCSIVLTEMMKKEFCDFNQMRLEVVPNFYDDFLNDTCKIKDYQEIELLYLSNIIKSKGIFELITSFKVLSKRFPKLRLHVAGDFIEDNLMSLEEIKKDFYSLIENDSMIEYHGVINGQVKKELLLQSDIFVLPTYYKSEAFPISIIEAMATSNAIVSTKYKYIPEIINEKNGILVNIKSTNELTEAIESLITDHKRLKDIQKYNLNFASSQYSKMKYIEKLKKIIR